MQNNEFHPFTDEELDSIMSSFEIEDYPTTLNNLLDDILGDCDIHDDSEMLENILDILKNAIPEIEESIYRINNRV